MTRERCCETKPGQIGIQFTAQPGGPTQTTPGQILPVMTLQTQLYNIYMTPKGSYLTSNIALFDIEISVIWKLKMVYSFCKKALS